jgi:hypothetical protein
MGFNNLVCNNSNYSVLFGYNNISSDIFNTISGCYNTSSGCNSVSFGLGNTSSSVRTTVSGEYNIVSGVFSVAFGSSNIVSGSTSYAVGSNNTISGCYSSAVGVNNNSCSNNHVHILGSNICANDNCATFLNKLYATDLPDDVNNISQFGFYYDPTTCLVYFKP